MNIQSLRIRCVSVPLPAPHRTASGVVATSPLVLLTVVTDDGMLGHSITFTYTPAALKPVADFMANLEPLVVGQPLRPAELSQQLQAKFRLLGTQGLVGMALAGLDMAMWDALARARQMPLYAVLGGAPKAVQAYGAVGYDGPKGSALAAQAWAQRGLKAVKAKIGYATVDEDMAVIRAMRSAAGPGIKIMVDYNQSLDMPEAQRRLRVLDDEGLEWIEEPVMAHDFISLASLCAATRTPLQAGENWWGPLEFHHAMVQGAKDRLMPDVMKCGGVSGWMAIAALAEKEGTPVSNHLWPEISAQLLYATPTAGGPGSWLEYSDWWNPILQEPLRLVDGVADAAGVIGTGVSFDEAAVARYLC